MTPTPEFEAIQREGWDTPAAEWYAEENKRLRAERAELVAACQKLRAALLGCAPETITEGERRRAISTTTSLLEKLGANLV